VRNYENDRTLPQTRQAPGRLRRITAAGLVDNVPGGANKDGKPNLRALSPAEIKRIETLVQQAVGFDAKRGDAVSVVNAAFARDAAEVENDAPPIWENPRARDLLRTLLGGLAVLLVVWFVLRPAFRQLLAPRGYAPPTARVDMIDEDVPVSIAASAPGPGAQATSKLMNFDEKLNLARTAVTADPKRVAQVVRDMVGTDG
jgi:flagellar M-ring protein FliF